MDRTDRKSDREDRINEEAAAMWRALHDTPPPCEGAALLDLIVATAGGPDYDRLANPWLRDRNLVWPVRR